MLERLFPTHSSPVVSAEKAAQAKQVVKPSGPWQWLVATLRQRAWSPYVCGAAIGLLQVPTMLLAGSAIGTSSAFATVASQVRSIFDQSPNVYFAKFADGCTSGHGLSGVAQLAVSSFVATATMFAAAMASGTEVDTIHLCACLCLTLT